MSVRIQIADHHARRLEQLAQYRGVAEDVLIEEALEMLFRQRSLPEDEREARDELHRMETEIGPLPTYCRMPPLDTHQIVAIIGTPIPSPCTQRSTGE